MAYNANIPNPGDLLSVSQGDIKNNFSQANTSFGIDHYAFDNTSPNNGFHNKVTTPVYIASPPTGLPPVTIGNPTLYGFQQTTNLGAIQYSRGPNNAIPTPITRKYSQATAITLSNNSTTDVFDFTSLTRAMVQLFAANFSGSGPILNILVVWTGTGFIYQTSTSTLSATNTGNILQLKNVSGGSLSQIYWTVEFLRLQ